MASGLEKLEDIDRELEALGEAPEKLLDLVARYGGAGIDLDEADQALAELEEGVVPTEPETLARIASAGAGSRMARKLAELDDEDEVELVREEQVEEGFVEYEQVEAGAGAGMAEEDKASLAGLVEQQLDEDDARDQLEQEGYGQQAGSGLDEEGLFADAVEYEQEAQEEPEIEPHVSRQQMDSDFKQLLDLELDPTEFPQSEPPSSAARVNAYDDAPANVAQQGSVAPRADGYEDDGEIIDELDEEFLDLLDEDIVEIEED